MKTSKSVKKRDTILQAAARIISKRGYAETTLAEIGEAAGTFAGSLYYYFPSKDALVEAVLNVGTTSVSDRVRERVEELPDDASAEDKLYAALAEHFDQMLRKDDFIVAYWKLIDQVPPEVRERHLAHPRAYGRFWRGIMEQGQREGVISRTLDAGLAQLLLLGPSIYALQWFDPKGPMSARDLSVVVANMFLHGVGAESNAGRAVVVPDKPVAGQRARRKTVAASVAVPSGSGTP